MLLLARADADTRPPARLTAFDARDLVAELTMTYRHARVPVTLQGGEPVIIMCATEELRRAISNVLDNAVRHAETRVEVATSVDHDHAVISVSDDGPGIQPEDRERVFERFTRLDDSRGRSSGGAGLGLAIVRELVTRAGGTVALGAARPPLRTRAELRLPLAPITITK